MKIMRLRGFCAVLLLLILQPSYSARKRPYIQSEKVVQDFMDSLDSPSFVCLDSLLADESKVDPVIDGFIAYYDANYREAPGSKVRANLVDSLSVRLELKKQEIEAGRMEGRPSLCGRIKNKVRTIYGENKEPIGKYWPYVVGGILLLALFLSIEAIRRRREATRPTFPNNPAENDKEPEIVVRRKTTTILKKQSLEDVLHSDAYLRIDAEDFCTDSAVRRLYVKNTCIKEIYDMYAADLRNPDNPKEDGCMVLGRWVHDDETDEYYVSLEYVVMPGDDAVFQEYALNFGGKIKLRVAETLRRLRRDTELQYDLTCWVHSHPGLGVFFSNSDNGVHLQLKHATHPKFLTAIVIDILTPDMEAGIFTFKTGGDLVVNAKQDLFRLYSLEEMYQWALSSEHASFNKSDYFNVLVNAEIRDDNCAGIWLSNGAIIDICQMLANQPSGMAGFVRGLQHSHGISTEFIVEQVAQTQMPSGHEMLGCFVVGSHLSLPSIQKTIAEYVSSAHFVLFYSTASQSLFSIPIVNGAPVMEEAYYSEESLDKLKIWTRRKR